MSQLALPFEETGRAPAPSQTVPAAAARRLKREVESDSEYKSLEENSVQASVAEPPADTAPLRSRRIEQPQDSRIGSWPAGLTWDDALRYSSLSASQLRRWQKAGVLKVRRVGRHGAKVVMRSELDRLLERVFAAPAGNLAEDFDFG